MRHPRFQGGKTDGTQHSRAHSQQQILPCVSCWGARPHHKLLVQNGDLSLPTRVGARGFLKDLTLVRHLLRHGRHLIVEVLHRDALTLRVQEQDIQHPRNLRHLLVLVVVASDTQLLPDVLFPRRLCSRTARWLVQTELRRCLTRLVNFTLTSLPLHLHRSRPLTTVLYESQVVYLRTSNVRR